LIRSDLESFIPDRGWSGLRIQDPIGLRIKD
jgi:hypothetical protein